MGPNRHDEIGRAPVVEEENPLTESPQGCRPKLNSFSLALEDVVGESWPHLVQRQIRVQVGVLVAQGGNSGAASAECRSMAERTPDVIEHPTASGDRC